jgi:phospholipid/cholesterol/gamma-HCH transport system ATP-binding protein
MMHDAIIKLIDVKKQFGSKWVSRGVTLDIPRGKMTVVIGRSGEGKSVLLKQMIGLLKPTSGQVIIEGTDITALDEHELDPYYQKFGYVFQFAALLDSLNVIENVGITLLENKVPYDEVVAIVQEKIGQVNLEADVLHKFPSELSGGMRKRVGLARTLVTKPEIILYDEPTTGLDPITTRVIHELMYTMQQQMQITSVVVSHDTEIFKYADYVALLHEGKIEYFGDAKTIWESDNPYIYQFIRGLPDGPIQADIAHTSGGQGI